MEQKFTITVYSENHAGLLHRVTTSFTRRKINIESLTVSESEVHGIHRFTIVVFLEEDEVKKVVAALEKQIEIYLVLYYSEDKVVTHEIAMYKMPAGTTGAGSDAAAILEKHNARLVAEEDEFSVWEKTGHREDTQQLFVDLEPLGILEFVRSGRVAITKPMKPLHTWLQEIEMASAH